MSPTTPTRRSEAELRHLAEQGARDLDGADTSAIIDWAARHFAPEVLTVACSMADAVLPSLVSRVVPGIDVLFLDTGYHFSDTLATRQLVAADLDVTVVDIRPELTVAQQDAAYGPDLFANDPAACCRMRKVEPLRNALIGYEAWFTGVRRDESPTRASTPPVAWDAAFGLVKVNPLIEWTFEQLMSYAATRGIPVNLLVSAGYPSIGCEPCTKPVAAGEDPRSGRWAGFAKTECGLHSGS
ncbi:MAG: phosphoadenylyl-sulfate reductase [Nostocoides sp.]